MGFRISYIVAPVLPKSLVNPLGFRLGVETDALPYDEWWTGTLKSNEQSVFWAEAEDFVADVSAEIAALSQSGPVVACRVDEDGQKSSAICYESGRIKWQIESGPTTASMIATGDLPDAYATLLEEFADKPLLIPTETAASVSGFNHETDLSNRAFSRFFRIVAASEVTETPVAKPGFFKKLFGG